MPIACSRTDSVVASLFSSFKPAFIFSTTEFITSLFFASSASSFFVASDSLLCSSSAAACASRGNVISIFSKSLYGRWVLAPGYLLFLINCSLLPFISSFFSSPNLPRIFVSDFFGFCLFEVIYYINIICIIIIAQHHNYFLNSLFLVLDYSHNNHNECQHNHLLASEA